MIHSPTAGRSVRRLAAVVCAACWAMLSGCAISGVPTPSPAAVREVGARLSAALTGADQDSFTRVFADTEHAQALGRRLYQNLTAFEQVSFAAAEPEQRDGVRSLVTTVSWSTSGEAANTRRLRFVMGDDARLRSLVVEPPLPLWALTAVTVTRSEGVTLVMDDGAQDATGVWLAAAGTARSAVADASLGILAQTWSGDLVVEVPAFQSTFETMIGAQSGSYSRIGAVTTPAGDLTPSQLHVLVNPLVARESTTEQAVALLTHEAVHVATGAPGGRAPLWLTEGLAESVSAAAEPGERRRNREAVLAFVAEHGLPSTLPSDADFDPASDELHAAYSLAQVAVDALITHLGRHETMTLIHQADQGEQVVPEEATAWYRSALAQLR